MSSRYLENVLSRQDNPKMSCRYFENVLSRQDNSKTIQRCLEDVLCRLGYALNSGHYYLDVHLNFPSEAVCVLFSAKTFSKSEKVRAAVEHLPTSKIFSSTIYFP